MEERRKDPLVEVSAIEAKALLLVEAMTQSSVVEVYEADSEVAKKVASEVASEARASVAALEVAVEETSIMQTKTTELPEATSREALMTEAAAAEVPPDLRSEYTEDEEEEHPQVRALTTNEKLKKVG
jgi:hypothetical protein